MPFTSGTYTLPAGNPVSAGSPILAATTNTTNSDIATALSLCILKDGTQAVTANIPMASHKFTGLSAGTSAGDSVEFGGSPSFTNLAYTGTLTGSTGILDIGSGQIYKDTSGNVGIGTSNPAARLDLGTGAGRKLNVYNDGSNAISGFGTDITGSSYELSCYSGGNGGLGVFTWSAYNKTANTYTERMRIDSSGNVGIGTSSPSTQLHIASATAKTRIDTTSSASTNPELQLTAVGRQFNIGVGGTAFATTALQGSYYLYDNTAATYRMVVDVNGDMGIGTTTPSYKLQVNGAIGASSIVVTGNATASFVKGLFIKDAPSSVAFTATAAFAVSTQTQMYIGVNGTCLTFASGTVVAMPTAVVGTDYAIWAETAGTLTCTNNFTTPPTANARKIGGFHYAPGGNATAQAGGNTTPYINAYSFWDLKFKPACNDPRGMTLVAGNFWADIYLLNTDPDTNGTSKYNVTIADGASPPKVPTKFGGNGTTAYTSLTWWEANEVLAANGKRSASYQEYAALAYGTTEATSIGTDQVSTILNAAYTSRWGVMQSTGVMDVWGKDFGGGAAAAGWVANTTGRGQTYQLPNAVFFGGDWSFGAVAGSRSSEWNYSPAASNSLISGRGVCDHLLLD